MNERDALKSAEEDAVFAIKYMESLQNRIDDCLDGCDTDLVWLEGGQPLSLLHGGHHFHDAPRNRFPETDVCPMDFLLNQVKVMNLVRPTPN